MRIKEQDPPPVDQAELARISTAVMSRLGVPGIAVGVVHQGATLTMGFGVTNIDHPLPVDDLTLFRVASITKTVVGTAIMSMVEQGRIDLDAPIRAMLPHFRVADQEATERLTLRDFLAHRSGLSGIVMAQFGRGEDAIERYIDTLSGLTQRAPVGAIHDYNSAGIVVAGRVLELAFGAPFEEAIAQLVFEPLRMRHSFFLPEHLVTHRLAVGHTQDGSASRSVIRESRFSRTWFPAAGMWSCSSDMLRFAAAHLGHEAPISAESLAKMHSPQTVVGPAGESGGLTWMLHDVGGLRLSEHAGGAPGSMSILRVVRSKEFAVIAMANSTTGMAACREISRWVTEECLGAAVAEPIANPVPLGLTSEYAGRYVAQFDEVILAGRGDDLSARLVPYGAPDQVGHEPGDAEDSALGLVARDWLVGTSGSLKGRSIEILRKPDGKVGWLRLGVSAYALEPQPRTGTGL